MNSTIRFVHRSNFGLFRRHFPDLADQLYMSLDPSTQRTLDRELDAAANSVGGGHNSNNNHNSHQHGTSSMNASLRGSNSSLNSMSGGVISMCFFMLLSLVRCCSFCSWCLSIVWYLSVHNVAMHPHLSTNPTTCSFQSRNLSKVSKFEFTQPPHSERRLSSGLRSPATAIPTGNATPHEYGIRSARIIISGTI